MSISGVSKYTFADEQRVGYGAGRVVGVRPADGLPVVGSKPGRCDMTAEQADELLAVGDYKAGFFRMWIEDERQAYVSVMDRISAGQWVLGTRRELIAETAETGETGQHIKIWLEWKQMYLLDGSPQSATSGGPR